MKVTCSNNSVCIDGEHIKFEGYTLSTEIARGANGVVVGAVDNNLNRRVAIKLWHSKDSDSRDNLLQGKSEATKIASIPHQNIVTVFNAGIVGNCFYLVMEFLPGKSLREILTGVFPGLAFRTKILSQIVKALRHAHRNSVYHGDLHDRNVVIIDDHVKIIDFGTSRFYTGNKVKGETESSLILKLCRNIFPEIEVELRKHDKSMLLNPRLTLFFCESWVRLISQLEITHSYVSKKSSNEHLLLTTLFGIALNCAKCPYIDLEDIVEKLNTIGVEPSLMARFFEQLLIYCQLEINPENQDSVSSKDVVSDNEYENRLRIVKLRNEIGNLLDIVSEDGAVEFDRVLYS